MKKFALVILTAFLMLSCFGLVACKHEHVFDRQVTKSIYRKSIATCETGAVYYKSCACGEAGTETFSTLPLEHLYVNRKCLRCPSVLATSRGLIYKNVDENTCLVFSLGTCTDNDIVIPAENDGKAVIGIDNEVFKGYDNLESITIPNTMFSIGKHAFSGCANLKTIIFAEDSKIITINEGAFENCSKLEDLSLPNSLEEIKNSAFSNCTSIDEITIPNSTISIGKDAFTHCFNLKNLTLSNSLENIGDNAFAYCDLETVTLPSTLKTFGVGIFANCTRLASIELSNNENFKVIDGNLYTNDEKTLLQYAIGKTENSFVVPSGVTNIGEYAFAYAKNLVLIVLPSTLTKIGDEAFSECNNLFEIYNLSNIDIVKGSVKNGNIAYNARDVHNSLSAQSKTNVADGYIIYLDGQESLLIGYIGLDTALEIPNYATKIEESAFENNNKIESIKVLGAVTSINDFAFAYCYNLKNITIGKSVTNIGIGAFLGCSKLETITFEGTIEEWNNITKGFSWDFSTGTMVITCSDGVVQ